MLAWTGTEPIADITRTEAVMHDSLECRRCALRTQSTLHGMYSCRGTLRGAPSPSRDKLRILLAGAKRHAFHVTHPAFANKPDRSIQTPGQRYIYYITCFLLSTTSCLHGWEPARSSSATRTNIYNAAASRKQGPCGFSSCH